VIFHTPKRKEKEIQNFNKHKKYTNFKKHMKQCRNTKNTPKKHFKHETNEIIGS